MVAYLLNYQADIKTKMAPMMHNLLSRLSSQSINKQPSFWRVPGRIAYIVNHSYPYSSNGYAMRTSGVASALKQHGHSVIVINRPGLPWDLPDFKNDQFPVHHLIDGVRYLFLREPSNKGKIKATYLSASAKALKTMLRVFKPTVVMAASNWENALPAAIAARELDLPFFYEVRGFWEITRVSREPEWQNSPEFNQYVKMETTIAQEAERVFTLNRFMRDELGLRGVDLAKIDLVPNGYVALPDLSCQSRLTKADIGCNTRHVVGYVGSFNEYEGLDDLVRACAQLRKEGVDLSLLLVGASGPVGIQNGKKECSESTKLQQLAKELGFADYLHLPGRVGPDSLADYYKMIDIVVISRKGLPVCNLVSPIKPLEAAAYGKPLLLSDVRPLDEFAKISGVAITYKADSENDLQEKLKLLLMDNVVRKKMGDTARRVSELKLRFTNVVQPIIKAVSTLEKRETILIPKRQSGKSISAVPEIDSSKISLRDKPYWLDFPVTPGVPFDVFACIEYRNLSNEHAKKALCLIKFFDVSEKEIPGPYKNCEWSKLLKSYFCYLPSTGGCSKKILSIIPPLQATTVRIGFRSFFTRGDETVVMDSDVKCQNRKITIKKSSTCLQKKQISIAKPIKKIKVAIICDEFSFNSFKYEFTPIVIEPWNWKEVFKKYQPDMFFCESAWSGIDSKERPWKGKIYASTNFKNENRTILLAILNYCKKNNIKTVFWNKEDPAHFTDRKHDFVKTACLFDYVFTTAEECIQLYREQFGCKNVFCLPFATQPRLFNPIETYQRSDKIVFAGSWYDYHEERCVDMRLIFDAIIDSGLDLEIFDRYYGDSDANHFFPIKYQSNTRPSVPFEKIDMVYKSSKYGLNINTVKHSRSMFARRIFELMSSNTLVVSNHSIGVENFFGNNVLFLDRDPDALRKLTEAKLEQIRDHCLHLVLEKHTYAQRFKFLLNKIDYPYIDDSTGLTVVAIIEKASEIPKAIKFYQKQVFKDSKLLLILSKNIPSIEIAPIYSKYNNESVNVVSMHYLQRYCEDISRILETSHFALVDFHDDLPRNRLHYAYLHTSYVDNSFITLDQGKRYAFSEHMLMRNVIGHADRFEFSLDCAGRTIRDRCYSVSINNNGVS
jgi:glycosyltransferase involved in cell wall biosynthesis/spore maturation protein CgeB